MTQPGNKILYHQLVVKCDIPSLSAVISKRIKLSIEQRLVVKPELYGIPLRGTLKRYWKLRVGDWRVVYSIKNKIVYILVIAHRREVYDIADRRLG